MVSPNHYVALAPIRYRLSWVYSGAFEDVAHLALTPHGCELMTICGAILMTGHDERAAHVRPCIGCLQTLRQLVCADSSGANGRISPEGNC